MKRPKLNHVCAGSLLVAALSVGGVALGQNVRPDAARTKSSDALRSVFSRITGAANRSTVTVRTLDKDGKPRQLAFGTVAGADGFVLSKASELVGHRPLQVVIEGQVLPAKLVGVSSPNDLAMLQVTLPVGTTLSPADWADMRAEKVEVGAWVATAGPRSVMQEEPVAVGVVSVGRRKIPGRNGFLGIAMDDTPHDVGAKIRQVIPGSAAEKAGLKVDDVVTAIEGKPVRNRTDLSLAVRHYRPGDVVVLAVQRGDQTMELTATLGTNMLDAPSRFSMMNLLGGPVSKRASDFSAVFQHDTVIRPMDCGGPLVDLSGKVIGINIARAGRTETYALPADVILPLIAPLENGKLAPVNANAASGRPSTMPEHGE